MRPFGLTFATASIAPVIVDLSGLRYNPDRQLSVDDVWLDEPANRVRI